MVAIYIVARNIILTGRCWWWMCLLSTYAISRARPNLYKHIKCFLAKATAKWILLFGGVSPLSRSVSVRPMYVFSTALSNRAQRYILLSTPNCGNRMICECLSMAMDTQNAHGNWDTSEWEMSGIGHKMKTRMTYSEYTQREYGDRERLRGWVCAVTDQVYSSSEYISWQF